MILTLNDIPLIYRRIAIHTGDTILGRVQEVNLDTFVAKEIVGERSQDWSDPDFIRKAERWGARNVMLAYGSWKDKWRKIPAGSYMDGGMRMSIPGVHTREIVYRERRVDSIWVFLPPHLHQYAHLVHPNCEVRLQSY